MKSLSVSLITAIAIGITSSACSRTAPTPEIAYKTEVFAKGDYDSNLYRIPVVAVADDGILTAKPLWQVVTPPAILFSNL